MISFFKNIGNNITGILIGAIVGIVIALIFCAVIKQYNNKILVSTLTLILAITGAIVGYEINNICFNKDYEQVVQISYKDIVNDVDQKLKDNWTNTNGGFTFEQIKQVQQDPEAPVYADQIIEIGVQDFGDYQCFFIKKDNKYYNISFIVQSYDGGDDCLRFDGSLMNKGHFEKYVPFLFVKAYSYDKWTWIMDRANIPYYQEEGRYNINNQISLSTGWATFCPDDGEIFENLRSDWNYMRSKAFELARVYAANNLLLNFSKYNNNIIEVTGNANSAREDFNNLFTYLFGFSKKMKVGDVKHIDVSSNGFVCIPIPEEERVNYPISNQDAYKVGDNAPQYYGVYNSQIAVRLVKYDANKKLTADDQKKEIDKLDEPKIEPVKSKDVTLLNVSFKQTTGDMIDFDLATNPITITFASEDKSIVKKLVIDSLQKINNVNYLLLESNTTYTYIIDSAKILFDNISGAIKVGDKTGRLEYEYSYLNGYIIASVGLNPVGDVDKTNLDLSTNPVKIILNHKESKKSFTFEFYTNSMLDTRIPQMVLLGEYSYSILSDALTFASTSGTLTITQSDHIMLFNYAYSNDTSEYAINITTIKNIGVGGGIDIGNGRVIYAHCNVNIFEILNDKYPFLNNLSGKIILYSNDSKIAYSTNLTFNKDAGTTSTNDIGPTYTEVESLNGTTIYIQLQLQLPNDKTISTSTYELVNYDPYYGLLIDFTFEVN